jgi:hypothetical protein
LLASGLDRPQARIKVAGQVEAILKAWERGPA